MAKSLKPTKQNKQDYYTKLGNGRYGTSTGKSIGISSASKTLSPKRGGEKNSGDLKRSAG